MALSKESFLAVIEQYTGYKRFIVAFSGGLDSSVLLHLCVQIEPEINASGIALEAIYIDHQLQQESATWASFCQNICQQYQIPFQSISVDAQPKKRQSPEAAAREARYHALKNNLSADDCLLTAHHQSDQAETLLLQMLRGAGPKGLSAMPELKPFYQASILRPLLNFSQSEIRSYAELQQLRWIDDKSNLDLRYKRNFIRHKIMPTLAEQWPSMEKTLHRVTRLQAESVEILDEVAQQDIDNCRYQAEQEGRLEYLNQRYLLSIERLQQLSLARINNAIQYWLRTLDIPVLNAVLLQRLHDEILSADEASHPIINWQNAFALRRHKGFLVLSMEQSFDSKTSYQWDIEANKKPKQEFHTIAGTIQLSRNKENGFCNTAINPRSLGSLIEIRFRQGGERFRLPNNTHHSLKKWLQENSVPTWLRDKIPLFFIDNQLIQVGNCLVDQRFQALEIETGVYLLWHSKL